MTEVNIHDAKTHFSQLLAKVARGEEVIIARAGKPIARLLPIDGAGRPRKPGMDEGRITIASDFDAPLPPKVLRGLTK